MTGKDEIAAEQETGTSTFQGIDKQVDVSSGAGVMPVRMVAERMPLYQKEKVTADMFYVAYLADKSAESRPLTFMINGGPGAASVFLHMGCAGPKSLAFNHEGKPDIRQRGVIDNPNSWLEFTDLVFIDIIETGYSRMRVDEKKESDRKGPADDKYPYAAVNADLDALGEFIQSFLKKFQRWRSPLFFAGESYGGFRAGKMAKQLRKKYQISVSGVLALSPLWEFAHASGSEYSSGQWLNLLPSYALTAYLNGLSRHFTPEKSEDDVRAEAEHFALTEYAQVLAAGNALGNDMYRATLTKMADMIGLDIEFVMKSQGRVRISDFARMLRQDESCVLDLYDGSLSETDPFPHRTNNEAAVESTLFTFMHDYRRALHQWLCDDNGLQTTLEYHIINEDVHKSWKNDEPFPYFSLPGAMDDFREGMSVFTDLQAFVAHGLYDTVTPYFETSRLLHSGRLTESVQARITERYYQGGHMFYSWQTSQAQFRADVKAFMQASG